MGRDTVNDDVFGTVWVTYILTIISPFGGTTFLDHVYEHLFKIYS
jgi:hypothetical protein